MAFAAVLLLACPPATLQQAGGIPFVCAPPDGYAAFAPVAGQTEAWESANAAGARILVQRFQLESPGARADLVARESRESVWKANFSLLDGFAIEEFAGDWGGIPAAAGHTVRYVRDARAMAVLERIAVTGDRLVLFTWEGAADGLAGALVSAVSFQVPDAWIPPPAPTFDATHGLASGSAARAFPWRLAVRVDLVAWIAEGGMEVSVRAEPADGAPDAPLAWLLPPGARALDAASGEALYRLEPAGRPEALVPWGIAVSSQGDLGACDAGWVAVPDPGPGNWLPPEWTLEIAHPGHWSVLGPDAAQGSFDAAAQCARTRFAPVRAGSAWPFFLAGRFEKRLHGGIVWHLRLDAQAITPDEPVLALAKLQRALHDWLPATAGAWTLVSFPGLGDRALPGLFVLDETRGWFAEPADGRLGVLGRRAWLARLAASSCFGVRLRGSGSGAPVMEVALAEYAAARLLERAGWTQDAVELRAGWKTAEEALGALPVPVTLLPSEDVFGAGRILTRGARAWSAVESRCGREAFDQILADAAARGTAWSTQDLLAALPAAARAPAAEILYGTGPL
jgi:hypothetical protein